MNIGRILHRFTLQNVSGVSKVASSKREDSQMSESGETNRQRKWNIFARKYYGDTDKAGKKKGESVRCCKPAF
jgi:hypothetical protein